jgi:hypothetical protein
MSKTTKRWMLLNSGLQKKVPLLKSGTRNVSAFCFVGKKQGLE